MSMAVSPIIFLKAWIDSTDATSKTEVLAPSEFSCLSLGPSVRDVAYVVYPWIAQYKYIAMGREKKVRLPVSKLHVQTRILSRNYIL